MNVIIMIHIYLYICILLYGKPEDDWNKRSLCTAATWSLPLCCGVWVNAGNTTPSSVSVCCANSIAFSASDSLVTTTTYTGQAEGGESLRGARATAHKIVSCRLHFHLTVTLFFSRFLRGCRCCCWKRNKSLSLECMMITDLHTEHTAGIANKSSLFLQYLSLSFYLRFILASFVT